MVKKRYVGNYPFCCLDIQLLSFLCFDFPDLKLRAGKFYFDCVPPGCHKTNRQQEPERSFNNDDEDDDDDDNEDIVIFSSIDLNG